MLFRSVSVKVDNYAEGYKGRGRGKAPFKIICSNDSGYLAITYFNARSESLKNQFPIGAEKVISGKAEFSDGHLQMVHPDYVVSSSEIERLKRIEATYPLTYGVTQKMMRKYIYQSLQQTPDLEEWCDKEFLLKHKYVNWKSSLYKLHYPENVNDISLMSSYRDRKSVV